MDAETGVDNACPQVWTYVKTRREVFLMTRQGQLCCGEKQRVPYPPMRRVRGSVAVQQKNLSGAPRGIQNPTGQRLHRCGDSPNIPTLPWISSSTLLANDRSTTSGLAVVLGGFL